MLFQTFDEKEQCVAIYANDKVYFKKMPKNQKLHFFPLGVCKSEAQFQMLSLFEKIEIYCNVLVGFVTTKNIII